MGKYCSYLLYKYSCLVICAGIVVSFGMMYGGLQRQGNNFVMGIARAVNEKKILYYAEVTDRCEIIRSENLSYTLCGDSIISGDRCSVRDNCENVECEPCYYKCGLCPVAWKSSLCKDMIKINSMYENCGNWWEPGQDDFRACKNTMIRSQEECMDTTKEADAFQKSPTFRCPKYPVYGIKICNSFCNNGRSATNLVNMTCFGYDYKCNCNRCLEYSQHVCHFERNYYYFIERRFGYAVNGSVYFTGRLDQINCGLDDIRCMEKEMNKTEEVVVFYDRGDPRVIVYELVDSRNLEYCNALFISGVCMCVILICVGVVIYRKSKNHSDFLIDQQHATIERMGEEMTELELRPPLVGGHMYEESKGRFENTAAGPYQSIN